MQPEKPRMQQMWRYDERIQRRMQASRHTKYSSPVRPQPDWYCQQDSRYSGAALRTDELLESAHEGLAVHSARTEHLLA